MSFIFTEPNQESLVFSQLEKIIQSNVKGKIIFGFMPAVESKTKKYYNFWKKFCKERTFEFVYIDNTVIPSEAGKEYEKLNRCNILLITGGNTYELLRNLRRSGFDEKIKKFSKRKGTVIAAFSAGAIVLGSSIRILEESWVGLWDDNSVGVKDLTGLGIINKEIFPHFKEEDRKKLLQYEKDNNIKVITLKEKEFLVV